MKRLNVIVIIDGPHTMPETGLSILFTSINSLNLNGKNKQTGDGYCGSQFMDKETGYKGALPSTRVHTSNPNSSLGK